MASPTNTGQWARIVKLVDDSGNVITSQNSGLLVSLADAISSSTDSIEAVPPIYQEIWASAVTITSTTNYNVTGLAGTSRMAVRIKVTAISNDNTFRWVWTLQRKLPNGDYDDLGKTRGLADGAPVTFDRIMEIRAGDTPGVLDVGSETITEETVRHATWNDEVRIVVRLSGGTGSVTFTGSIMAMA